MKHVLKNLEDQLDALLAGSATLVLERVQHHKRDRPYSFSYTIPAEFVTFVERGRLGVKLNDRKFTLFPGQCLWLPHGTEYNFYTTEDAPECHHLNIQFNLLNTDGECLPFLNEAFLMEDAWDLQSTCHQLYDLWSHAHPLQRPRAVALIGTLITGFAGLAVGETSDHFTHRERITIHEQIMDNLKGPTDARSLAESVELSPEYFTRKFRKTFGLAPRFYIKQQRIHQAAVLLLETKDPLKKIADEVGIENLGLFCRQFREIYHCTPTEYRRR
jgi:AraC-like DNA-binding protein